MFAVWARNIKWLGALGREAPLADSLCDAILKRFSGMDECPGDWPDDWKQDGASMIRRESTIYRLSSVRCRRSICIKIIKGGSRGLEDAADVYAALHHYHARSDRENGYTVPEPYGCVPEHNAVIMEWVEGRTFSEILKSQMFFTKRRHENIRKVAGWLRWFHSQSEVERGTFAKGWLLKGIVRVFDEASDLNQAATAQDPALREYLEVASKSSEVLHGTEIDRAVLHGDFKPTNLLISHSGVVVGIDFLGGRRGPVSHDICRFLSELDFYRNLHGRSFALSPGSRTNDFDAFLTAYGKGAGVVVRPAFVYLYFLSILSVLVHQRRKFKRSGANLFRLAIFRGIARQLSHELSKGDRHSIVKPKRLPWLAGLHLSRASFPIDFPMVLWESDLIWSLM